MKMHHYFPDKIKKTIQAYIDLCETFEDGSIGLPRDVEVYEHFKANPIEGMCYHSWDTSKDHNDISSFKIYFEGRYCPFYLSAMYFFNSMDEAYKKAILNKFGSFEIRTKLFERSSSTSSHDWGHRSYSESPDYYSSYVQTTYIVGDKEYVYGEDHPSIENFFFDILGMNFNHMLPLFEIVW